MPLTLKTRDELIRIFKDHIRGVIPGADVSDGSDYDLKAKILADVFRGNQGQADYLARQILPGTAEEDFLARHAEARGTEKQAAAAAQGKVFLTSTSNGDTQAAGSTLTHADGTKYELTAPATTHTPGFSGKSIAAGSSVYRLIVDPHVTGMDAGDGIKVGASEVPRVIKAVISTINAIDLYEPLDVAPTASEAIVDRCGVMADVIAQTTGASTNKDPGDTVTVDSPVGDIDDTATVLELSGGGDEETDSELQGRLTAFDAEGRDATAAYWRDLARACPGVRVEDAIVYMNFRGLGAHDIVLIGVEDARLVSQAAVDAVQDYVDENGPSDDIVVKQISYSSLTGGVQVTVYPAPGYEADWEGSFTVDSTPASTTTKIYTTVDPTGTIDISDRVVVAIDMGGSNTAAYLRTVESVGSDYIIVTEALPQAPASADEVWPAGPLTETVAEAIEDMLDDLGPGASTTSANYSDQHERFPDPDASWKEWLRLAKITDVVMDVDGVNNVTVTNPSSDTLAPVQQVTRVETKYIWVKYAT